MKLNLKFAILMLIPLASLGFTYWTAAGAIRKLAEDHIEKQAKLLMEAATAIRGYTETHIQPKMNEESEEKDTNGKSRLVFNKEWVPAFAARETLKTIYHESRQEDTFKEYLYREVSTNPTNRQMDLASDVAGRDETGLIQDFKTTGKQEVHSPIKIEDKPYYYFARPIIAKKENGCMRCHGSPAAAPTSMKDAYHLTEDMIREGKGGFEWEDGQVAAAQIVYVPRSEVEKLVSDATQSILFVLIPAAILMFASFLTGVWWLVIRPVARLSERAEEISMNRISASKIPVRGRDEIAQLTASFNRMNQSLYQMAKQRQKGS